MDIRKLRGGQYFHISPDNIVVITISVADMASFITSCNPTSDLSMGDTLISPLWPVMLQLVERDQDSVWTMVQCVIMSRSSGHWTRCHHMSLVSDTTRAGVIDGLWTSFFNKKLWLIDALGGWYYCRVGAESCVISWESLKAVPSYINTDLWLSPLQNNHLTDTSHRGICVVSVENNLGYSGGWWERRGEDSVVISLVNIVRVAAIRAESCGGCWLRLMRFLHDTTSFSTALSIVMIMDTHNYCGNQFREK